MINEPARILIIGCDGMIGTALMSFLVESGVSVIGTTRRKESITSYKRFLDLTEKIEQWIVPPTIEVAVLLAGESKVTVCQKDPERTRQINVEKIVYLANYLIANDVFVVYLSTNQVFDGSKPYQTTGSPFSPITEYGKQSTEVETKLQCWGDSVAILRSTKIFGNTVPLFHEWYTKMRAGDPIHPFSDMTLAPIPLRSIVSVLKMIIDQRKNGVFQISGDRDLSYDEVAFMEAEHFGLDVKLIKPILASQFEWYKEPAPKHTTLDMERLKELFGIVPPESEWTLYQIYNNIKNT